MKKIYFVMMKEKDGKQYSYVQDYHTCSPNLASAFRGISDLLIAMPCESKKQAEEIADNWNATAKADGRFSLYL